MTAREEDVCKLGELYSNNLILVAATAVKSLLAIAGCIGFLVVLHFERITAIFHVNARLILKFHIGFLAFGIVGTLFGDGYDLLRFTVLKWTASNPDCPVPPLSAHYAVGFKLMKLFAYGGTAHTAAAWVLERAFATYFASAYADYKTRLGWSLCFISTITIVLMTAVRVTMADFSAPVPLSMVTGTSYQYSMILQNVTAFIDIFNVVVISTILVINNRRLKNAKFRINSSLAYKYSIRENALASALVFPLALLHCASNLPVAVILPIATRSGATPLGRIFVFTVTDWSSLYFAALPMLLYWRHGVKRNAVKHLVQLNLIGVAYAEERRQGDTGTARHFEMINRMLA